MRRVIMMHYITRIILPYKGLKKTICCVCNKHITKRMARVRYYYKIRVSNTVVNTYANICIECALRRYKEELAIYIGRKNTVRGIKSMNILKERISTLENIITSKEYVSELTLQEL